MPTETETETETLTLSDGRNEVHWLVWACLGFVVMYAAAGWHL